MQNIHIFWEWLYDVLKAFTNLTASTIAEPLVWWHMAYGKLLERNDTKKEMRRIQDSLRVLPNWQWLKRHRWLNAQVLKSVSGRWKQVEKHELNWLLIIVLRKCWEKMYYPLLWPLRRSTVSFFCFVNWSFNMKCHSQNEVMSLGWWQQLELQNS